MINVMSTSPIIRTIKKVMPSVVSIVIAKKLEELERDIPHELLNMAEPGVDPKALLKEQADIHGMVRIGGGSGFIVHANGIILTNKHVVADAEAAYTVFLNNEKKYMAAVIARDPIEDIAILKIDADHLPTIRLGDSSKLELGEEIIAIGNALGIFKNTVSRGIVSGLSRSIRAAPDPKAPVQELRGLIQTDAAINPGNSGGPLVNLQGEAIGINAAIVFGAQNLSFALPINAAKRDLQDLKEYGRIRKPLLGLRYILVDENLSAKMHLESDHGALVLGQDPHSIAVVPNSPAHRAGIRERDLIISCNGEQLTNEKTIQDFLENMEVGQTMHLDMLRNGKNIRADVILAERK